MVSVLRPGQRIHHIPGIGVQTSRRAVVSGAAAWYLAGGAPTPIAVYQPKGAADLAASYVNLVNPGTYDVAPGVAPTFDAATGWTFNGSSQYLTTGIVVSAQSWSVLVRFSNVATGFRPLYGARNSSSGISSVLYADTAGSKHGYDHFVSSLVIPGANLASGIMAVAGTACYLDGLSDGTSLNTLTAVLPAAYIGSRNNGGSPSGYFSGKVQAVAIWNTSTNHAIWMPAVMAAAALI